MSIAYTELAANEIFANWESDGIFDEGSTHHYYLQDHACLYYILGPKDYNKLTFIPEEKMTLLDDIEFHMQKWPLNFDYSKPVKVDAFKKHLEHMA